MADASYDIDVQWQLVAFSDLTVDELYDLMRLRQRVFVVEQTCPFLDADGLDRQALHLMGWTAGSPRVLSVYARLLPPGGHYKEASIGRVVSSPEMRGSGFGRRLMAEAIRRIADLWPGADIRIGAQRYLERFYESLGFRIDGEPYIEDGIPHIEMIRRSGEIR